MKLFRLGLLSALLLLVACGSTPTGTSTDETGSSPAPATASDDQIEASPQPAMTQTAMGAGQGLPLAVLMRSGGMLGQTETLVVQRDGLLQLVEGEAGGQMFKEGRATTEQVQKLEAAIQSEAWDALDPTYGRQVPDGYAYTIVANSKLVQTYDGAENPSALADVLGQLNDLWQQALEG